MRSLISALVAVLVLGAWTSSIQAQGLPRGVFTSYATGRQYTLYSTGQYFDGYSWRLYNVSLVPSYQPYYQPYYQTYQPYASAQQLRTRQQSSVPRIPTVPRVPQPVRPQQPPRAP